MRSIFFDNQYNLSKTTSSPPSRENNLSEINNLDRSGLDVPTLCSTVSGQTRNQDPDVFFNFVEINTLDRSGVSSLASFEKWK